MRTHDPRQEAEPSDRAVFDSRPEIVAHARDLARAFLDRLRPSMDAQSAASVELVVSELVTNVVRHARSASCALQLRARPDAITVGVADTDPRLPRQRVPDLAGGTGGFGWPMVQNLARAVTVTVGPQGKTILADMPR
ncbi:ATP-binding protein [Streptomyces sp. SP18CS02]|uniref:ATP-binding protein n=1 Tax=Streptomyces sp. SP18CS02 TaxID=3002531 RepID=UPI002E78E9DE|nr:ATP-binding protein [Streptomyces sp. SP18CS02]MEE1752116.1 ATP-binding protein [Streptomyces sp. SP18CS02]